MSVIKLKGYPHGIQIAVEKDADMEDILAEISDKFKDSEKFFGTGKKAISFVGKNLSKAEEEAVLSAIQNACDLNIICIVSKEDDELFVKALESFENTKQEAAEDGVQFYKGSLNHRDVLETNASIIILGDVKSGATVVSQKDIIVLGQLLGNAYGGVDGKSHFIAALHMDPESIRIGEQKGTYKSQSKWKSRKKEGPKIAYIKEDQICFEDLDFTQDKLQILD